MSRPDFGQLPRPHLSGGGGGEPPPPQTQQASLAVLPKFCDPLPNVAHLPSGNISSIDSSAGLFVPYVSNLAPSETLLSYAFRALEVSSLATQQLPILF